MKASEPCQCGEHRDGYETRRSLLTRAAGLISVALLATPWGADSLAALPITEGLPDVVDGDDLIYAIPAADGAVVDREHGVIVARVRDQVMAFNLACPHENAAIRWKPAPGRFECSRHNAIFDPAGVYTSGPAKRNLDRFAVRQQGISIVVDVSRLILSDQQHEAWANAVVQVGTPAP
jgi:nitrite reductase/ring-hydroxylating ferredoxin subunit